MPPRSPTLSGLPFNRLIPNILTVLALCAGLTAILYGFQGKWKLAVLAILLAGVLDALDGRVARLLGGTTRFGAELDSLSDFVSFGVAPAVLLFLWTLQDAGGAGWVAALVFAVCAALRLARFNTRLADAELPPWTANFFTGVPAPAAGGLVLLPMMLSFEFERAFFAHPLINAPAAIALSYLMISRIPTFSFKQAKVPHHMVVPTLLLVGLLAALLVTATWLTVSGLLFLYLLSIPVSVRAARRLAGADPAHGGGIGVIEPEEEEEDEAGADLLLGAPTETGTGSARSERDGARRKGRRIGRRPGRPRGRGRPGA